MDYFKEGDRDVIYKLNSMVTAFNAGPYGALSLTGGTLTGDVASSKSIYVGNPGFPFTSSGLFSPYGGADPAPGQLQQVAGFAVRGISAVAHHGQWQVRTSVGSSPYREGHTLAFTASDQSSGVAGLSPLMLKGNGDAIVGDTLKAPRVQSDRIHVGYTDNASQSVIAKYNTPEGTSLLTLAYCADYFTAAGPAGSSVATVMSLIRNSLTGRSFTSSGGIYANGADYAEYLIKGLLCGTIVPGQIVGIDADGRLTDKWDLAISFCVKSTNPCMVGGDTWSAHLGPRPTAPEPVEELAPAPVRRSPTDDRPGDTDQEWEAIQADYARAVAAHQDAVAIYAVARSQFDAASVEYEAALETARQTVDRIAFAGQVPVNLQGAMPGQFIVPVQDGDGIAGQAVDEDDMTLRQYMRAIGRVIAIEDDGRARIIVKVA